MATLARAVRQESSHKGEDAYAVAADNGVEAFAIFDGHGGKDCSYPCADPTTGVLAKLVGQLAASGADAGTLPAAASIEDAFWAADAELGQEMAARKCHAGTTATALFVGSEGRCALAWVGDSTAIGVDMESGCVASATRNHAPDNASEAAALHRLAAVSKQVRKAKKLSDKSGAKKGKGGEGDEGDEGDEGGEGEGGADPEFERQLEPPTSEDIAEALAALKEPPAPASELAHLCRALVREKLILRCIPKGGKYRRNVHIYPRPVEKDPNQPLAIATHENPYSSHHRDLQMTRSICDWTKTAWILPHPEIAHFAVEPTTHLRIVLASDGLWDVISHSDAAKKVRAAESVDEAADALMAHAMHEYIENRGLERPGDDTTIMVVEINPSAKPFTSPPPEQPAKAGKKKGGGCAVS